MKTIIKSLILLAIIIFAIISCEKDEETIVDLNNSPFIGAWVWIESGTQLGYGFTFTQNNFIFFEHEVDFFHTDSGTYVYNDSTITFNWPDSAEYVPTWVVGEYPFELKYAFIQEEVNPEEKVLKMGGKFYIKEQ